MLLGQQDHFVWYYFRLRKKCKKGKSKDGITGIIGAMFMTTRTKGLREVVVVQTFFFVYKFQVLI